MSPSASIRCGDRSCAARAAILDGARLLAALLVALMGPALAAQEAAEQVSVAVDLVVDGRGEGTIDALISGAEVALDRARLSEALASVTDPEALASVAGSGWIALAALREQGLDAAFDAATVTVRVGVPAALRRLVVLGASHGARAAALPVERPALFSGYLNLTATAELAGGSFAPSGTGWAAPVALGIEPVLNLAGWVLEARCTLSVSAASGAAPIIGAELGAVRLVKDFPRPSIRVAAGSLFLPVSGFQPARSLYGLEMIRDPGLFGDTGTSSAGTDLELESPGRVDLALNGRPLRSWALEPGRYRIAGIELEGGLNRIDIGGPDPRRLLVPWDPRLLRPGETTGALGFGSAAQWPPAPVLSGWVRRGLGAAVTGSLDLQAGLDRQLLGVELLAATAAGNFYGGAGLSLDGVRLAGAPPRAEPAAGLSGFLQYRLAYPANTALPRIVLEARYAGPGFLPPGATEPDPFRWQLSASWSQLLPLGFGLSVGASWGLAGAPESNALALAAALSHPLRAGSAFSLLLTARASGGGPLELAASVSLAAGAPDGRSSGSMVSALPAGSTTVDLRLQPSDSAPVLTASFDGFGPGGGASGSLGVQYLGSFVDASLADVFAGGGDLAPGNRLTVSAGAALVTAGGAFAVSRPVLDSFAIVVPSESLASERVVAGPSSGGRPVESRPGWYGVLSQLAANQGTVVTLQSPEAPAGADVGASARLLAPTYRSGLALRAGTPAAVYVEGAFVAPDGKPLAWRSGRVLAADATRSAPFFTDERGVFQAYGLVGGEWTAEIDGAEQWRVSFVVPRGTAGLYALEPFRLAAPAGGE